MFSAARWAERWEALGGYILVGEGCWGENGARVPGMCEMMPQLDRRPLPEREVVKLLRKQVAGSEARLAVIERLARRAATRGF